jgi:hypothetical protein
MTPASTSRLVPIHLGHRGFVIWLYVLIYEVNLGLKPRHLLGQGGDPVKLFPVVRKPLGPSPAPEKDPAEKCDEPQQDEDAAVELIDYFGEHDFHVLPPERD